MTSPKKNERTARKTLPKRKLRLERETLKDLVPVSDAVRGGMSTIPSGRTSKHNSTSSFTASFSSGG
jgi:hypothetical protein